jgi:tricorn protease-like protein
MFDKIDDFVMKPRSKTIAYATSSNLVVRDLVSGTIYAGKMMDYTTKPIYDWRKKSYISLGVISRRVYLLECRP